MQLSEPAQTAAATKVTGSSVFSSRPVLLESAELPVSPSADSSQALQAAFSANENVPINWMNSTAPGSTVPSQRPGVPRPSGRRFVVRNVSTDIEGLDLLKFLKVSTLNGTLNCMLTR